MLITPQNDTQNCQIAVDCVFILIYFNQNIGMIYLYFII